MSAPIVDEQFKMMAEGFSLTTAEIMYRMPDYNHIIQLYIWQDYDTAPEFPKLKKFLNFWERELDGPLCEVRVAHSPLIRIADFKPVTGILHIH